MNIGSKIKSLRQKYGLTQENLANSIGVSAQSVSKWENGVSMPDIVLLPVLAEEFGVSVDELFDLTAEEKMRRIEKRIEREEEFTADIFKEYEEFLLSQTEKYEYEAVSLLAHLYHHRMTADAEKVRRYAQKSIMMYPEKKDCQWLLDMAWGQKAWDWNIHNHSAVIDFYKAVIENDKNQPKASLAYKYLIGNLLADNRTEEAKKYLNEYVSLPSHDPVLVLIYKAHIALAEQNAEKAELIINDGMAHFANDAYYLFQVAQYYAEQAKYEKAIEFYEKSWVQEENNKPRFTDTLDGIATIYSILGNKEKQRETYGRIVAVLKDEWGMRDDDRFISELEKKKNELK